jgi:hypothetical protein
VVWVARARLVCSVMSQTKQSDRFHVAGVHAIDIAIQHSSIAGQHDNAGMLYIILSFFLYYY